MNNKEYIKWDVLEQRYWNSENGELYKTIEEIPEDLRHLVKHRKRCYCPCCKK